jgi:hypothetical protein
MPTPQEGVFLEPVDREIMVVEKYNYNDFISSFFFKESAYEAELPNGVGSACERTPFRVDESAHPVGGRVHAELPIKREEPYLPQERETTPENTYEVPIPQTPARGNEYNSRKRPNRWVPRSSNVRRRFDEPSERNGSTIFSNPMATPL